MALELARRCRPALLLLDLMMPVMHGWDYIEQHRADPDLAGVPVIAVSSYRESLRSFPADGFLLKPVELARLLSAVSRSLPAAYRDARAPSQSS